MLKIEGQPKSCRAFVIATRRIPEMAFHTTSPWPDAVDKTIKVTMTPILVADSSGGGRQGNRPHPIRQEEYDPEQEEKGSYDDRDVEN